MKMTLIGLVIGALFGFGLAAAHDTWLPWSGGPEYIADDLGQLIPSTIIGALLGYWRHRQQKNAALGA
jgi:ABC-type cobalt transport system substrate-binding protein